MQCSTFQLSILLNVVTLNEYVTQCSDIHIKKDICYGVHNLHLVRYIVGYSQKLNKI